MKEGLSLYVCVPISPPLVSVFSRHRSITQLQIERNGRGRRKRGRSEETPCFQIGFTFRYPYFDTFILEYMWSRHHLNRVGGGLVSDVRLLVFYELLKKRKFELRHFREVSPTDEIAITFSLYIKNK